ncbi:FAD-dependent monooxygenase [Streptomyces coacervatus]|uniref:FAD-dependent monooxygenase n=2 Tax=Streptomyces coacervatus TaxID=647381 RepID=A0ABP7HAU8_9ACTN|nr:FAD-dependent monooxygenase [Streptomyces coacervatus]MDF2265932.1 FAD-dependent monooxygenase [Streptomyces coacervatus]
MDMNTYDVVVAGAGPVGLLLGCELRLGGAQVLVVERLAEVDETIKAGSINLPSAEALYRRGLLPALAAVQEEAMRAFRKFRRAQGEDEDAPPPPRFAGHFAGIWLHGELLDETDPEFAGSGPAERVGFVPQATLERILARRAEELGVEVRRRVELTGFEADEEQVVVQLTRTDDLSVTETVGAGWLVGCDGGRSVVRKLAGFDFPGTDPEITGYQALVEMTGAEGLKSGWNTTDVGTYVHGPMPGRILTVEFDGPPADRQSPITARELEGSLRRVTGVEDVTVTAVHSATRFTDNCRQASSYRKGRVLLAGDAAHVHSPFGGQGLNLGVGDAMNLGWKLAAVVRGSAPEGLLDSYTAERHPIGAWVLDWTRAQIALMRPESHARALREVITELSRTVTGTTFFAKKISGVWQRYDLPGDHPLVGRSAPDLELADGSRLADHLHTGRALLLDLADDPKLRARAEGYGDRLTVVSAGAAGAAEQPELAGMLVRPDGFVAWAADEGQDGGDALEDALKQWLGA